MKLLYAEDEPALSEAVVDYLTYHKYIVDAVYDGADAAQHSAGRVGNPMDIANLVLYLCSDKAGFITGQNICVDGGMTRHMIYHNDYGWTLAE